MVVARLFTAAVTGRSMPLYGDGTQPHSWTHVDDLVSATVRAGQVPMTAGGAEVVNVAGPECVSLVQVTDLVEQITGRPVPLENAGVRAGDASRDGLESVLKVGRSAQSEERLGDEALVLEGLRHEHLIVLKRGVFTLGNRHAIEIDYAGEATSRPPGSAR